MEGSDDLPRRTLNESSIAGDSCITNLLKTKFLLIASACVGLFDHLCQAANFGEYMNFSSEEQNEIIDLLQKGVIFVSEAIRHLSTVAPLFCST